MTLNTFQKDFLKSMEIKEERFATLSSDNVDVLIDIAEDYEQHRNDLLDEANYIANKLQRCKAVHSVRSRVKDTSHLVEKIIRKWEQENVPEKYKTITKDNYKTIITDLVGVRAIYLFKKDWEEVHNHILSRWEPQETVTIYYREGDDMSLYDECENCEKQVHFSGYRSIHYLILATKIDNQVIYCEIQTRTIFEEGWSEIDHKVRYPSFLEDMHLQTYLNIFNRFAGGADEMGSFVQQLVQMIKDSKLFEEEKKKQEEKHNIVVMRLEEKIEKLFEQNAEIDELKSAYEELKRSKNNQEKYNDNIFVTPTFEHLQNLHLSKDLEDFVKGNLNYANSIKGLGDIQARMAELHQPAIFPEMGAMARAKIQAQQELLNEVQKKIGPRPNGNK